MIPRRVAVKLTLAALAWVAVGSVLLLSLAGCSSFRLGGVAYCPWGQECGFQMRAPAPAVAASGVTGP
jgi:hypothetical protein